MANAETRSLVPSEKSVTYDAVVPSNDHSKEHKDQGTHATNSVPVTGGIIIGDAIGAAMLSMSASVATFGWLLGSLLIAGILALNLHLCMILWRLKIEFPEVHTLRELAVATHRKAPLWQQRLIGNFTEAVQNVFIFFMLAADAVSFGKGLGMLFYDVHICLPVWVLIGCAVLYPIHVRTRSLGVSKTLLMFNIAVILMSVVVPMAHIGRTSKYAPRPVSSHVTAFEPLTVMGILNGLNIMTFNFTIQFAVVEIVAEMKEPHKFPRALWGIAYPFLLVVFLVAGVGGYVYLGDEVHGLLLNYMIFGVSLRIAAACLVAFVLITYLLKSVVLCRTIHAYWDPKVSETDGWNAWRIIVLATLGASWLVSQLVPFFTPLVDLIGATLAPLCCMVLPIAMYVRWYKDCSKRGTFRFADWGEWLLIAVEIALSLLILTVGTYDAAWTIITGWKSYGAPFACHCQHLWNTCQCSATDPGMQFCPAAIPLRGKSQGSDSIFLDERFVRRWHF